nr:origin of replication complex subunit 4 [Ipomoea batatas]
MTIVIAHIELDNNQDHARIIREPIKSNVFVWNRLALTLLPRRSGCKIRDYISDWCNLIRLQEFLRSKELINSQFQCHISPPFPVTSPQCELRKMGRDNPAEQAVVLLRTRICNPNFIFTLFSDSPDSNYSKLKYIVSSSVTEACNNSVLLLGPRGCGKNAVLELVLEALLKEFPDMISVIKLNGLLHSDDNCALKEITRQLCSEHQLVFSKMASFDDNSQFLIAMLRECGLAHKTVIFVLDEFDLFTQGKQRLLYSLLDAMQSVTSQAVVIGVSCRLDADQLLEKRVRSRFSHRKLIFLPPSREDLER